MLQRIGAAFTEHEPGTTLVVLPNLGSGGAIAGVTDGLLDFAVSGRPLNSEEAKSLTAIVLASTPFGLASSQPNPGNIKSVDIAAFFQNVRSVWPDGTPVRVVLRSRAEVDAVLMANMFPNMAAAIEQLRGHTEIPVVATDQDNVLLAEKMAGSLTGVTLTQVVPAGLSPVRGDATRLRQVLASLIANALKFTPAGGEVGIDASQDLATGLTISVSDTGIGIDPTDLTRVMEPFEQVSGGGTESHTGIGLGLPLARHMAELHGGTLTLRSHQGGGTTAWFTLPAHRLVISSGAPA